MIHVFVFAQGQTQALANAIVTIKGVTKQVEAATRKASFDLPVPGTYTITAAASGYQTKTADYPFTATADIVHVILTPMPPPQPGEVGRVGYCSLQVYTAFNRAWYKVVHDDGTELSSGLDSLQKAKDRGEGMAECQVAPSPAKVPATQADINALRQEITQQTNQAGATLLTILSNRAAETLSQASSFAQALITALDAKFTEGLGNLMQGLIEAKKAILDLDTALTLRIDQAGAILTDRISKETTALDAKISGIWDKLEGWLVERIVAILLKGLDREVEKEAKK